MLIKRLNAIISEFDLLKHPFYQAWSKGELSQDILRDYASQYYHQVKSFPRFISRVHTHCPEWDASTALVENLQEEVLGNHPGLWMQFAEGMGATPEMVENDQPLPETKAMVDTYYELADGNWLDGLCALYAYEYQVPEVAASKIAGLKQYYGITDARTLEFFTAHQVYDVEHAAQVATLIERYAEPKSAELATKRASEALWKFLDGMCRVGNIHC